MNEDRKRLTLEELDAEQASTLPDKEVVSLLDLFVNIDLALDLAAPIDLAVAANANAALPIEGAVSANVLSFGSDAQAGTTQVTQITQGIYGDATATAPQSATIDQSNDVVDGGTTATEPATALAPAETVVGVDTEPVGDTVETVGGTTGTVGDAVDGATGTVGDTVDTGTGLVTDVTEGGGLLSDGLLKLNVDVALDADMAAPIAGAVAANANVAAPVDAAVSANILSFDSTATAVAQQSAVIEQTIQGNATATADQDADIIQ